MVSGPYGALCTVGIWTYTRVLVQTLGLGYKAASAQRPFVYRVCSGELEGAGSRRGECLLEATHSLLA